MFGYGNENLADLDPTYGNIGALYYDLNGSFLYLPGVKCDYEKHFAKA